VKQYQQLFQSGQYGEAAKVAANSPRVRNRRRSKFIALIIRSLGNFTDCRCDRIIQTGTNSSGGVVTHLAILRYPIGERRT